MGDSVGRQSGDGLDLGVVLTLLHRADAAFDRVEVTYRIWRHPERAAAAWQAQIEEERRRGASISSYGPLDDDDRPVETEEVLRIWRDGDRVREERHGGPRDGDYAVRNGELWWSWNGLSGATSNEDRPEVGFSVGEEISLMLDPTPLLGFLRFALSGRGQVAGRDTITVDALPRLSDPRRHHRAFELHEIGAGADRYTLQVDARLGVLLEAMASRGGQPFQRITTDRISFDQPIPDERFSFQPPPGEKIQSMRERHRLVRLALPDAQRRAPFTILIPDRIPPDWHYTCAFIEASPRPPSPAGVSLLYHSDDGHEGLSLSEHAAGDQPDQYDLMLRHDDWQTLTDGETEVRYRRLGSQAQACVERAQTFVFLMSESLSGEQLAAVAAGLKPAPGSASL